MRTAPRALIFRSRLSHQPHALLLLLSDAHKERFKDPHWTSTIPLIESAMKEDILKESVGHRLHGSNKKLVVQKDQPTKALAPRECVPPGTSPRTSPPHVAACPGRSRVLASRMRLASTAALLDPSAFGCCCCACLCLRDSPRGQCIARRVRSVDNHLFTSAVHREAESEQMIIARKIENREIEMHDKQVGSHTSRPQEPKSPRLPKLLSHAHIAPPPAPSMHPPLPTPVTCM